MLLIFVFGGRFSSVVFPAGADVVVVFHGEDTTVADLDDLLHKLVQLEVALDVFPGRLKHTNEQRNIHGDRVPLSVFV